MPVDINVAEACCVKTLGDKPEVISIFEPNRKRTRLGDLVSREKTVYLDSVFIGEYKTSGLLVNQHPQGTSPDKDFVSRRDFIMSRKKYPHGRTGPGAECNLLVVAWHSDNLRRLSGDDPEKTFVQCLIASDS